MACFDVELGNGNGRMSGSRPLVPRPRARYSVFHGVPTLVQRAARTRPRRGTLAEAVLATQMIAPVGLVLRDQELPM